MPTKMGVKHKRRNDVLHGNESDKLDSMQQLYSGQFGGDDEPKKSRKY